ncbi:zinc-ribbon domain-containing protein [Rhodococcus qingshengii]|uniref:zinc-ribbon domain-containing protein n=1 Tax=Rhodococcus qingshengii TaxID=334542 RepID=UPI001AEA4A1D|nr:zinc-ribbon domain-containing protein [Rhodococcus qingshengii]
MPVRAIPGLTDLATLRPDLAAEWDAERNKRQPTDITPKSSIRAWWRCGKKHSYQACVADRTAKIGPGCPYCTLIRPIPNETDLPTTHPEIASQWHPTFNGDRTPTGFTAKSNWKAWWRCAGGHEYQTEITKRTNRKYGCPHCAGRYAITGVNDLATTEPEIAKEWDTIRNDRPPTAVKTGSEYSAWWICPDRSHSYASRVEQRVKAIIGCPYCGGRLPIPGETDLATLRPEVAREWHPTKNTLSAHDVLVASNKSVWWACSSGHEWKTTVASRTGKSATGCPVCSNRRIEQGINDLATLRPDIAAEWHPTRNSISSEEVSVGSAKKAWWLCTQFGHEWQGTVNSRTQGNGCPVCSGRRTLAGFNDLDTTHPHLANQWHPTRNAQTTSSTSPGSAYRAWWICPAGHEYLSVVSARVRGRGCAYCAGKQALAGFNDLATTHPTVAAEWHPTKNSLIPSQVTSGSKTKIWWQCAGQGHDYQATVETRTSAGTGCPVCTNRRIVVGFNDLATLRPELAAEWHPTKNLLTPARVGAGSHLKAWWQCRDHGHEWPAVVVSRVNGRQCPICAGRKVLPGFNDLRTTHPAIASEWHSTKNTGTPIDFSAGSDSRVWWRCRAGHEWEVSIGSRTAAETGCPHCCTIGTSMREQAICQLIAKAFNQTDYTGPAGVVGWRWGVDLALHHQRVCRRPS